VLAALTEALVALGSEVLRACWDWLAGKSGSEPTVGDVAYESR
jgi:hypothetical protein